MQQKIVNEEVLRQFTGNSCTREQLLLIQEYLQDPAYQDSLESWMKETWDSTMHDTIPEDQHHTERYAGFVKLIHQNNLESGAARVITIGKKISTKWRKLTAAAVLVVVTALSGWLIWKHSIGKPAASAQQWVVIQNEPGKRTKMLLPDSSVVFLAGAAKLQYNKNYNISNRDLLLEGEAYFIVHHEREFPFSVTTGKVTTVDIGTAFNIRSFDKEPLIQITVAEGSVSVKDNSSSVPVTTLLNELQQLNIDRNSGKKEMKQLTDGTGIGGWRNGLFIYKQQSFQQVASDLERFYGVTIRFENPKTSQMLITTTLKNVSLPEAIDILKLTTGTNFRQSGNELLVQ